MTSLRITSFPDLRLRSYCTDTPSDRIKDVKAMSRLMFAAMDEWQGVGLAANQVGFTDRLIVYDDRQGHRGLMINPEIVDSGGGPRTELERCLSLPQRFQVQRSASVQIKGITPSGFKTFWADGHLARILQHEVDHLNGVLIDRVGTPA